LRYQISIEAAQKEVRLGPHFMQFYNIHTLFAQVQGHEAAAKVKTVEEMMTSFKLSPNKVEQKSKTDCQSLVRITNRIVKSMRKSPALQGLPAAHPEPVQVRPVDGKQVADRRSPRGESPTGLNANINPQCETFIKISNLSSKITEEDIETFLHGISVSRNVRIELTRGRA